MIRLNWSFLRSLSTSCDIVSAIDVSCLWAKKSHVAVAMSADVILTKNVPMSTFHFALAAQLDDSSLCGKFLSKLKHISGFQMKRNQILKKLATWLFRMRDNRKQNKHNAQKKKQKLKTEKRKTHLRSSCLNICWQEKKKKKTQHE